MRGCLFDLAAIGVLMDLILFAALTTDCDNPKNLARDTCIDSLFKTNNCFMKVYFFALTGIQSKIDNASGG